MMDLNPALYKDLVNQKIRSYQLQAELDRQIPRRSLRHQIAKQLRAWAEQLEPNPGLTRRVSRA
jgi:hypothetical protein